MRGKREGERREKVKRNKDKERDRDRHTERARDSSIANSHMLFCSSSSRDTCYDVT